MATLRVSSIFTAALLVFSVTAGDVAERQINGAPIIPPPPPNAATLAQMQPMATPMAMPPGAATPVPMAVPPPNPPSIPLAGSPPAEPSMGMGMGMGMGKPNGRKRPPPRGERPTELRSGAESASQSFLENEVFDRDTLAAVNYFRKQHGAKNLKWNNKLAKYARSWSNRCRFRLSGGPFGELLSSGHRNATAAVSAWAYQEPKFDFANPENEVGHFEGLAFSQLVWKNTTQVGCARTNCGGEDAITGWLVVCEFRPRGNTKGMFAMNVQAAPPGTPIGMMKGKTRNGNSEGDIGMTADAGRPGLPGSLLAIFVGVAASLIFFV